MEPDYGALIDRLPVSISLPEINRTFRPGIELLQRVQGIADLPSRLIFGDVVENSFRRAKDGWAVAYRDDSGAGVDLKVSREKFEVRPFFLGTELRCIGRADQTGELGRHLSVSGGSVWDRTLKKELESKYPLNVLVEDNERSSACMIPDGWLWTILVPVRCERLNNLLFFHNKLNELNELATPLRGSVRLQHGSVEYYEGGEFAPCDEPMELLVRQLRHLGTPVFDQPSRASAPDGSTYWKIPRRAYLYRCTCFLRDLPRLVERLFYAGFLSREPDMSAAVTPTGSLLTNESVSWWSEERGCRNIWADFAQDELLGQPRTENAEAETQALVRQAMQASHEYLVAIGLVDRA